MDQGSTFDLYVLSEGCISNILSLTSPRDVCGSSVVSSVFQSAANSDFVWERFLPSDIQQILSSSVSPSLPTFSSKKELFLHLCDNPLLIDRGTKSFALEKCSGEKCYMIGAKELSIIWGDTPMYWKWRPHPESRLPHGLKVIMIHLCMYRFSEVAEILSVCWLEIRGKMETRLVSPNTTYGAYLVLMFTERAYGFEVPLAEVSVKLASGGGAAAEDGEVKSVYLNNVKPVHLNTEGGQRQQRGVNRGIFRLFPRSRMQEAVADSRLKAELPKGRRDGWTEIEMGEFFNARGEDGEVEMSLMEVKGGNWKSGLIIQGIELRPKENQ